MEFELTKEEIAKLIGERQDEKMLTTLSQLITYLRKLEKDFQKGNGTKSGLSHLMDMLNYGDITPYLYFKIRDVVENYNDSYEVVIVN